MSSLCAIKTNNIKQQQQQQPQQQQLRQATILQPKLVAH